MRSTKFVLTLSALCLAGCQDRDRSRDFRVVRDDEAKSTTLMENPQGRYEAVADPKGEGIFVLDTRLGLVRFCVFAKDGKAEASGGMAVGCTESSLTPGRQISPTIRKLD